MAHAERGDLDHLSLRAIAKEVGVSHTLVNYHFGGRAGLFAAVLAVRVAPHTVLEASIDSAGALDVRRLIRGVLTVWDDEEQRRRLASLARAATAATQESTLAVEYLQSVVVDRLVDVVGIDRGRRIAFAMIGVIFARWVLEIPSFRDMTLRDTERVVLQLVGERPPQRS